MRLAKALGMTLDEVMEKTSSRQLLLWNAYFEKEWNEHSKLDGYLAAILQAIDSLEVTLLMVNAGRKKVKRKVRKLDKYYLSYDLRTPRKKNKTKKTAEAEMMKMKFLLGAATGAMPPAEILTATIPEAE